MQSPLFEWRPAHCDPVDPAVGSLSLLRRDRCFRLVAAAGSSSAATAITHRSRCLIAVAAAKHCVGAALESNGFDSQQSLLGKAEQRPAAGNLFDFYGALPKPAKRVFGALSAVGYMPTGKPPVCRLCATAIFYAQISCKRGLGHEW